ncbi:Protein phosphatase 1 regulatory subunit 3A [Neolecta irregularis DAH-3]|uniref:Protein phosphatase 1 regulatory subunit 3A n=1 Tax=Neolecta irregularis (strain DAH-3) TaxID=1198029 RepID=A0A1U7LS28_NEOID|nr:Protein phosphatase 1 regulatory subunit 3A [Neolecta irregularis DAH-3]|eukprot:OLL25428.1 Protein phosphatase 1 regulatory subunit 3A [Neolecta irregularis DAH-3]
MPYTPPGFPPAEVSRRTPSQKGLAAAPRHHRRSSSVTSKPAPLQKSASFATKAQTQLELSRGPVSPPDSNHTSDDDAADHVPTGRKLDNLHELQEAIRAIPQRRASSPPGSPKPQPFNSFKVLSHHRSSSDTLTLDLSCLSLVNFNNSSDSDQDPFKPLRMIRKKSGELVRPSLRSPSSSRRPKSAPATPAYKSVTFSSDLEHVRHFHQSERPIAVSTEASPTDYFSDQEFPLVKSPPSDNLAIELPNFPVDTLTRKTAPVRLEHLKLSSDKKNLLGKVAVRNLAFNKWVAVRFTVDYWQTISEVAAEFDDDVRRKDREAGIDWFSFCIKLQDLANLDKKKMFLCVRYNVNALEYWDNNNSFNYQIEFRRRPRLHSRRQSHPGTSQPSLEIERDDFFGDVRPSWTSNNSDTKHRNTDIPLSQSQKTAAIQLVSSFDESNTSLPLKSGKNAGTLSNRYDFGASLNAARRTRPRAESTGAIKPPSVLKQTSGDTTSAQAPHLFVQSPSPETRCERSSLSVSRADVSAEPTAKLNPSAVSAAENKNTRPDMNSGQYWDFVKTYCFFQGGNNKSTNKSAEGQVKTPANSLLSSAQVGLSIANFTPPTSSEGHDQQIPTFESYYTTSSGSNSSSNSSRHPSGHTSPAVTLGPVHSPLIRS